MSYPESMAYLEIFLICAIPFFILIAHLYYEKQKKRQKELEERIKELEEKQT